MEPPKDSPFASNNEIPAQRNAPLAPSQELAYRKKCIQLKRRLAEIETNNDNTRRRISQEKEHVQKMRLLRAILLDHLKQIMETPGKKLSAEELEKIGVMTNGTGHEAEFATGPASSRRAGEGLLDDSSDDSDENEPEPQERPERRRRTNNNYRESVMTAPAATPAPTNQTPYPQQSNLPSLAPASSYSPSQPPQMLTSSFRVSAGTPQAASTPAPLYSTQVPYSVENHYTQHSSPTTASHPYQTPLAGIQPGQAQPMTLDGSSAPNGVSPTISRPGTATTSLRPQPPRPAPPFEQFTDHMRPQLEADNYPAEQIAVRIQSEWDNLSPENRNLWEIRYREQMMEFTAQMDEWKRLQRRDGSSGGGIAAGSSFSSSGQR